MHQIVDEEKLQRIGSTSFGGIKVLTGLDELERDIVENEPRPLLIMRGATGFGVYLGTLSLLFLLVLVVSKVL